MAVAPDEVEVTERFRRGDWDAFATLYERYRSKTYDQLLRLTRDSAAAEDMLQSAFVKVWEQRETLRDSNEFGAWLFRVVNNLGLDELRRSRPISLESEDEPVSPVRGPLASLVDAERAGLLRDALISLEPRQRLVAQAALEGAPLRVIARSTETSPAHASVLIFRSRVALRHALRALLVARHGRDCRRLAELVPEGVLQLTPAQRRTIDRHMRRCHPCRAVGDRLTGRRELFASAAPLGLGAGGTGVQGSHAAGSASMPRSWLHAATAAGAGTAVAAAVLITIFFRASPPPAQTRAPAAAPAPVPALAPIGRYLVLGGDPDVHAQTGPNQDGARRILQVAVGWASRGAAGPRVLLVSGTGSAGHFDPRPGLAAAGLAADFADAHPRPGELDLAAVDFGRYQVVVVASDDGGWLGDDELQTLISRRPALLAYLRGGGGVVALVETGAATAGGSAHAQPFGFLPVEIGVSPLAEAPTVVDVTPEGAAMGLRPADDAGNFVHAALTGPPELRVLERDQAGRILMLAGTL